MTDSDADRDARRLASAALDDRFAAIRDGSPPELFGRIEPLCELCSADAGERYDARFAVAAEALGLDPDAVPGSDGATDDPGSGTGTDGDPVRGDRRPTSVLDAACGAGGVLARLADRADRAFGLAADATLARVAARHAGVPVVAGDPLDPPVYGEFAAVVALGYPTAGATDEGDPARLFEALYDRTAPGGTLVCDALVEPRGTLDDPWTGEVGGYRVDRSVAAGDVDGDLARMAVEYDLTRAGSGESATATADVTLRLFDPEDLAEALAAAGFVDVGVGDRPDDPGGILGVARRPA